MHKLIHLAGKIKAFRERLGMTQKEFIEAVSLKVAEITPNKLLVAKLRETSLNPSLVSQWESSIKKNRANPSPVQLKAMALLSDKPWEIIWWFMRDDIDYKRGYELYPDGFANIAPPDLSADEEDSLLSFIAEDKARHEATPSKELTAWMQDESKMWDLHVKGKFTQEDQNRQIRLLGILSLFPRNDPCENCNGINSNIAKKCEHCGHKLESQEAVKSQQAALGIAGLLPGTPCKSCGYKNLETAIFCGNCGLSIHSEGIGGLLSRRVTSIGGSSNEPESRIIGAAPPSDSKKFIKSSQKRLGLTVSRGPVVSDFVDFPQLPPSRPNTNEFETEEDFDLETDKNFWSAVKFFASSDHHIPTEYFNQKIQTGAITQHAFYYDGDQAIQVTTVHRDTEIRSLRRSLQTRMMELCFIDRMRKRTAKKLILVCSYEKGLDLNPIDKHLEELIHSSELLGVQIRFASGPLELAEKIATFKRQKTLID